jgi:hypothetical protein
MMNPDEMNEHLNELLDGTVDQAPLTGRWFSFVENLQQEVEQEVFIINRHNKVAEMEKKQQKKPQGEEFNAYFLQFNEDLSEDPLTLAEETEVFKELCNDMPVEDIVKNLSLEDLSLEDLNQIAKSMCPPSPEAEPPRSLKMQRPRPLKAQHPYRLPNYANVKKDSSSDSFYDSSWDSFYDSSQESSGNARYYVNDDHLEWSVEAVEQHFANVRTSYKANRDEMLELQNHTSETKNVDIGTACNGEFTTNLKLPPKGGKKVYYIEIRPNIPKDEVWIEKMNAAMRTFKKGTNVHRLQNEKHIRAFFYAYRPPSRA